jgi:hypothetical protein
MTPPLASQETMDSPSSGMSGVLANIIELARLSRLTLLYHGTAVSAAEGGREQAAALASAAASGASGEVVVLFDAASDLPVPDLLAAIEAAVLEAAPDAPLAPPMAGPVEALAFWQQALGLRFVLILHRFDRALSSPDPEFDEVLLKLAHGPLDISMLLVMDEAAAPLLQRLKDALPELGETFLRLPEPAAATPSLPQERASAGPPAPVPTPQAAEAAPAARFGPAPFLFEDPDEEDDRDDHTAADAPDLTAQIRDAEPEMERPAFRQERPPEKPREAQPQQEHAEERRRSRRFSSLLEQAGTTNDAFNPPADATVPADTAPPDFAPAPAESLPEPAAAERFPAAAPLEIYPAAAPALPAAPGLPLPDGRAEPTFQAAPAAAPAAAAAAARAYRERRPMQVPAWMQKRRSRRRRSTVGIASRVGSSSTVLFVLLIMLAVLGWQMPHLGPAAGAASRGAAKAKESIQGTAHPPQAVALRGNRYRLSISSAASSAGTGRQTR